MFREDASRELPVSHEDQVWPVMNRDRARSTPDPVIVHEPAIFRAAEAAPDVPATVGILLFAVYLALIGALAVATAGPGESGFMLTIAGLFVVAFFAVPRLILAQEPTHGLRVTMDQFLAKGLDTYTGHCSGRAALAQMFVVPVLLTIGILLIAVVIAVG